MLIVLDFQGELQFSFLYLFVISNLLFFWSANTTVFSKNFSFQLIIKDLKTSNQTTAALSFRVKTGWVSSAMLIRYLGVHLRTAGKAVWLKLNLKDTNRVRKVESNMMVKKKESLVLLLNFKALDQNRFYFYSYVL